MSIVSFGAFLNRGSQCLFESRSSVGNIGIMLNIIFNDILIGSLHIFIAKQFLVHLRNQHFIGFLLLLNGMEFPELLHQRIVSGF